MFNIFRVVIFLLVSLSSPGLVSMMAPELMLLEQHSKPDIKHLYSRTFYWEGYEQGFRFQDCCIVHPEHQQSIVLARPKKRTINFFNVAEKEPVDSFPVTHRPCKVSYYCQEKGSRFFHKKRETPDLLFVLCRNDKNQEYGFMSFYYAGLRRFANKRIFKKISYFEWSFTMPGIFAIGNSNTLRFFNVVFDLEQPKKTFNLLKTDAPITLLGKDRKRLFSYSEENKTLTVWHHETQERITSFDLQKKGPIDLFRFCEPKGEVFATVSDDTFKIYRYNSREKPLAKLYESSNFRGVNDFLLCENGYGFLIVALFGDNTLRIFTANKKNMIYKSATISFEKKIISFQFLRNKSNVFVVMTQNRDNCNEYEVHAYDASVFLRMLE